MLWNGRPMPVGSCSGPTSPVRPTAPADFGDWASDPRRFVDHARAIGVIHSKEFPADFDTWARELRETRPLTMIGKIPPRPVLLVHGTEDETVPLMDARALADAADGA